MSIFNKYPYTDAHELNLDWILAKMQEVNTLVSEIRKKVDDIVDDETRKAVEKYFNDIMIDTIYVESAETITFLKEIKADGSHSYDADEHAMVIE